MTTTLVRPQRHTAAPATALPPAVLDVRDLRFTYAGKQEPALHGLTFSIQPGEIFGFLGPSGAGKSTTQKILMGLLQGYQGQINVFGQPLATLGARYYERIGVGFELPNHYQKLTALENLQFFRSLYSGPTADPLRLLEQVGLADDANRRVAQFSQGMQSRLTFVRALLNEPELIFLDEPTSGLDPANARVVKALIRDQQRQGRTIFLTTHDMHIAEELCDRVAFITNGAIALIDSPQHLMLEHSARSVHVTYRAGAASASRDFALDTLGSDADFAALLRTHTIETIHSREAALEDIFITVTGEQLQ